MRKAWTLLVLSVLVAGTGLLVSSRDADAAFHLMRIHAVMGGVNGDDTVQYVELRMCSGGQNFLGGHTIKFYDGAGTLKATFTFPSMPFPTVPNASTGESVLIATSEFNTASTGPGMGGSGGDADFVFSMANTVGANGGDPLHPIQGVNGKVRFGHQESEGCDTNFTTDPHDIDSVAYGTATADLGTAAPALPSPSDNTALRLSTISGPTANNTDYSLQPTSGSTKTVALASLTTDLDTPRNNSREVATFSDDNDGDGVLNASDLCPGTALAAPVDANGCSDAQVDSDGDGFCNPSAPSAGPSGCTGTDNCPSASNPSQANVDGDGPGDACDTEGPTGNSNGVAGGDDCADTVDNDADTLVDLNDPGCNTTDTDGDGVVDVVDNCVNTPNPGQANADGDALGDACDADADNDGFSNLAESGTPLCANAVNDDNLDDSMVNDGCPAVGAAESVCTGSADEDGDTFVNDGCPQVNTFSEGAFNIGTNQLGPCHAGATDPSPSWPLDFVSGGTPSSTDKITLVDLTSFLAPTRRLDQNPGNANFSARWDLVPGASVMGSPWIQLNDLTSLIAGTTGLPPMFGGTTKAFNGPTCSGA